MPRRHPRALLQHDPVAVRHGHLRRPDRQRQDHDAVRLDDARSTTPSATSPRSRTRSSTCSRRSTRSRSTRRPASPSPAACESILRQDPDVILVGEIRDVETARIAVQSALTGHFVLSSLHGTDAVSALYRFLDMGIESFLIASSVLGVVGQRLVRRSCIVLQGALPPDSAGARLLRRDRRRPEGPVLGRRGLQPLLAHRLHRPGRRLRAAAGDRRAQADARVRPPVARGDAHASRCNRACARCARKPSP